eukprot:1633057-Pyramimonas_sp.AAC.1
MCRCSPPDGRPVTGHHIQERLSPDRVSPHGDRALRMDLLRMDLASDQERLSPDGVNPDGDRAL